MYLFHRTSCSLISPYNQSYLVYIGLSHYDLSELRIQRSAGMYVSSEGHQINTTK